MNKRIGRTHRRRSKARLLNDPFADIGPQPEPVVLTARDWETFIAAWDEDRPRPNLEAAIKRYRERRPEALAP